MNNTDSSVPYGYCHCGCGQKTDPARHTIQKRGQFKGEPLKFRRGHYAGRRTTYSEDGTAKRCKDCKDWKLLSEFHQNKSAWDGLSGRCKPCNNATGAKWRESNPERYRESVSRAGKRWYEKNKEYVKARRDARLADPVLGPQIRARWNELQKRRYDPEIQRARYHAWRTKMLFHTNFGPEYFTVEQWRAMLDFYEGRCLACGSTEEMSVDHVVPLSKGGLSNVGNIQPLCLPCNHSKHAKTSDYRDSWLHAEFLSALEAEGLL